MDPFPIELVTASNDPNVWDILTAIGTVGAVIAAVILGWWEQHRAGARQRDELARLERERDEARVQRDAAEHAEMRRERESQARRVAIWLQDDPGYFPELMDTCVVVGNFSDSPIFAVSAAATTSDPHDPVFRPIARILPGQILELEEKFPADYPTEYSGATIEFRDMAGTMWRRTNRGGPPEELTSTPPD